MTITMTIIIASIVGAIVGLLNHLLRNKGSLKFPRKLKSGLNLGFIADMLFGSGASIFAVIYLLPTNTLRDVIGIAFLAALSAESVLLNKRLNEKQEELERTKTTMQRLYNNDK